MKSSWGSWYSEQPHKAIGEGAASVAIDDPGLEEVMHRSRGLSPWREPMRGYWWSLITEEDSSVLEMPVPCDDHQEQQQQWSTGSWSLEDKLCATKGRAGKVMQALGGARKIVSWIPDIEPLEFWVLLLVVTVPWYVSLLKEESILVEPTVERLWNFKRLNFKDIGHFKVIELLICKDCGTFK